ncbi:adenylate cyclase [Halarcobacter ebronensis]|uniref:Adenylate cyclase n=1 Tax=Halarcobacter ebronensis TaxID=1462615 RepID=A0A4Q0YDN1_9BACT|nr:CYTH domain-containing protein [Halarcobacter ebronensis]RXJ68580.1 adenylate cyclase [Halarcobacter ebronensis]
MALEIEKKFLVDMSELDNLPSGIDIKQGYIKTTDNSVVRVRIKGNKGFLTIKGKNSGASRLEFEYEIPYDDANEMLEKLCSKPIIDKTRYEIRYENHLWELDIFYGENEGLIVAEIELEDEKEQFALPSWVTKEVTEDIRYFNNQLMENPYKNWK